MKTYLPGFSSGFSNGDFGRIEPSVITQQQYAVPNAQDIPITLTDPKKSKVAQSTLAESGGNIISSGIAFAGSTMKSFGPVKGTNEILSDAGTSFAQGDGFGYQKQNDVDANY